MATVDEGRIPLGSPQLNQQPVNQSPDDMLLHAFMQRLQAQPPAPPQMPQMTRRQRFAYSLASGPLQQMFLQRLMGPQMNQYAQQAQGYEAGQKQLGDISSMYGRMQTGDREARLTEQFRWRQLLQSQYKRNSVNLFNPQSGLNERWVVFTDPTNNNIEVGRVPEAFAQMHYAAVAGPGGEMYQYPTSNVPPQGASIGGGPQPTRHPLAPPQPPPLPTGTPTTGSNVTGSIPSPQPQGAPPSSGNVRRLGVPKQPGASVAQNYAAQSAFLGGIQELLDIQKEANQQQIQASGEISMSPGGVWNYGKQLGKEAMTRSEFTQPLLATMQGGQNIIGYRVRMMPKLFNYVKAQTGVQFGYREFLQYSSLFPTSLDNPETAAQKIESLTQVIRANKTELERQFHALGQAQTPMIGGRRLEMGIEQFEAMQEEDPQAAQEFLQDGGVVR